jgi:hypothetical protein
MNWKNITLENGFIKQELTLNGSQVVNYIPLDQVDSFGVTSSENKRWLYAGIFVGICAAMMAMGQEFKAMMIMGMISMGLLAVYFITRQTWFTITSSKTKFSVQVTTTTEEIQAVNNFIKKTKQGICETEIQLQQKVA